MVFNRRLATSTLPEILHTVGTLVRKSTLMVKQLKEVILLVIDHKRVYSTAAWSSSRA